MAFLVMRMNYNLVTRLFCVGFACIIKVESFAIFLCLQMV